MVWIKTILLTLLVLIFLLIGPILGTILAGLAVTAMVGSLCYFFVTVDFAEFNKEWEKENWDHNDPKD